MPEEMTSVKVPKGLRDQLNRLAERGGRGTTLADVLRQLLEEHEAGRLRRRLAFEEQLHRAQADPDASARGRRIAKDAAAYLKHRQAVRASEAAQ
ncbi:hypothetical protein ACIBO5_00620 [Nonomuraea angiospora]|uniref:hypothetical protein n=1 Tax=Nonomuraea angiospora TaxID=46172 RepID=UPI0029BBB3F3|nr:hypothetical protein [Nonomuraea angiospora]MDX3109789.1 hypothetical protein [Nonomuraea angiospora]